MPNIKNIASSNGELAKYGANKTKKVVCWAIVSDIETSSGDAIQVDKLKGMVTHNGKVVPADSVAGFTGYDSSSSNKKDTLNLLKS